MAVWISAGLVLLVAAQVGCQRPAARAAREVGPGVMVLRMPKELGKMRRPPVTFDHDKHTAQVTGGCKTCHLVDRAGSLLPKFMRVTDGQSAGKLMDFYHKRCVGCHKRRGEGARSCGQCHAKGPRTRSRWRGIHLDYSLHARHVLAQKKKCADCHHVLDKKLQKLVYKKGAEESCGVCHAGRTVGRRLSLRSAAHGACISCHLRKKGGGHTAGPLDCAGCHSAERQVKIRRLKSPPRLLRGQKDRLWIKAAGGKALRVPFDHQRHEMTASRCSTCHHKSLASCNSCHDSKGAKKGGGVPPAQAHHASASAQSCVGCHRRATLQSDCAGCHHVIKAQASRRSCAFCHRGPKPGEPLPDIASAARIQAPLPVFSKAFPERVTLRSLARDYAPSVMPHGRIVQKLHGLAGKSRLAARFHGGVAALCAGCHHHAKSGTLPAPCSSCHTRRGDATRDRPALLSALHRQCIGCHQQMGLKKWLGCESCHKKAVGRRAPGGKP